MSKPCKECPYRKDSIKGWLGEDFGNPDRFLEQLEAPDLHPCHMSIDWDKEIDDDTKNAPICTGALQFMNNSCMMSKFAPIVGLQKQAGKNDEILQFKHNFIKHHKLSTDLSDSVISDSVKMIKRQP